MGIAFMYSIYIIAYIMYVYIYEDFICKNRQLRFWQYSKIIFFIVNLN